MAEVLRHRRRVVTDDDVDTIKALIAENPGASRRELSKKLCEFWAWRQPNGALRDMVCRGLMLALDRGGHIELPAIRCRPPNPFLERRSRAAIEVDQRLIACSLGELGPLTYRQVRRTDEESAFDRLIETHHYLGYTQPVGEHLKFLVYAGQRPVACFAWSSAPYHIGPRDKFIGWTQAHRRQNLRLLAYNSRFLLLPWVKVPHLASHLLGRMTRMLSAEWQKVYEHPVYYAETFVDTERFRGTCYRAANWLLLGVTTGRGKADFTRVANRSLKQVLGLPLSRNFRQHLTCAS
ncbi:DUF4338 domain-containing protein [Myxococcota bacterium]